MSDPLTLAGSSAVAATAAVFLQLLGIDLPPVLWAAIGASFMQGHSKIEVSRLRVFIQVAAAALLGGLMGVVLASIAGSLLGANPRPAMLLLSALCGFGCQPVMQALLGRLIKKIEGQ